MSDFSKAQELVECLFKDPKEVHDFLYTPLLELNNNTVIGCFLAGKKDEICNWLWNYIPKTGYGVLRVNNYFMPQDKAVIYCSTLKERPEFPVHLIKDGTAVDEFFPLDNHVSVYRIKL